MNSGIKYQSLAKFSSSNLNSVSAVKGYCDLDLCGSVQENGNANILMFLQIVEINLMGICRALKPWWFWL